VRVVAVEETGRLPGRHKCRTDADPVTTAAVDVVLRAKIGRLLRGQAAALGREMGFAVASRRGDWPSDREPDGDDRSPPGAA
jgi:hypothetical protein